MWWRHGTAVPDRLLRRRQPRALRHRPLQRAAAVVVLRAGHRRRRGAVVAVPAARRSARLPRLADRPRRPGQPRDAAGASGWWCRSSCSRSRSASSRATCCRCCRRSRCCSRTASSSALAARRGLDGGLYRQRPIAALQAGVARCPALILVLAGGLLWRAQPLFVERAGAGTAPSRPSSPSPAGLAVVVDGADRAGGGTRRGCSPSAARRRCRRWCIGGSGRRARRRRAARWRGRCAAARRADEPVGVSRVFVRNLVFYTGRQADRPHQRRAAHGVPRARRDGRWWSCRPTVLDRVEAAGAPAPTRLARVRAT